MHIRKLAPLVVTSVSLTLAAGCAHSARTGELSAEREPVPAPLPQPALFTPARAGASAASIADVVQKALPSVVNVSSSRTTKVTPGGVPFDHPFFRHFFGPDLDGPPPERQQEGMGSGVVVADGVVVTNNHVVEGADEIKITTADKREFDASVVGTDPKSDLAVLRLEGDASGLRPIEMGDSSRLRLGDVVIAIGNPFGVGQTVTMGIVSAKGRADVGIVDYEDFIQTDAAINPGNSGGALINMEGKLVGINTAILSRSGGYMGIGFAIPSNMARPIMESLLKSGRVVRGWLGVSIQNVDQDLAQALELENREGVLISDVGADTPAKKAGVQRGDVLLSVDGQKVDSTGQLRNLIAAAGAKQKVTLEILRKGKRIQLDVQLGEMPSQPEARTPRGQPKQGGSDVAGLSLEPLTPEHRRRFSIGQEAQSGVVIVAVAPGSQGAKAGLKTGDLVLEIDRKKVASIQNFREHWAAAKGPTLLLVYRQGSTIYVVARR